MDCFASMGQNAQNTKRLKSGKKGIRNRIVINIQTFLWQGSHKETVKSLDIPVYPE